MNAKDCEAYYCAQVGGSHYFQGINHQRGYGFFGDLRRYVTPLIFRAGRYLGKQLLETGKNVITDVTSGKSFKNSARARMGETSKKIKQDIFNKIQHGQGSIKRRGKRKKCQLKPTPLKVKRCKIQSDIFS